MSLIGTGADPATFPGTPSAAAPAQGAEPGAERARFLKDVVAGLTRDPKSVPSRYFYDAQGSLLFEAIMRLPEYYLTACETGILEAHKQRILECMGGRRFHLVDLGAGDGAKTRILLSLSLARESLLSYVPVDVSGSALASLGKSMRAAFPGLRVRAMEGDYLDALAAFRPKSPRLALFLGSSIGNFGREEAVAFLAGLRSTLAPGDALLIGFDLRKEAGTVLRAYSDSAGVTARFNYNLLARINRELAADFRIEDFRHQATYLPSEGVARSFLVSRKDQVARIGAAGAEIRFRAGECIHTESSYKYSLEEIASMASASGFTVARDFLDGEKRFADSLWLPRLDSSRPA